MNTLRNFFSLSVLTGYSRIWVRHHYPSDIIRSAFISTMTSTILDKISHSCSFRIKFDL
ncbi:phosphatase PAP2 family protein [Bacillus sp. JJ1521]|uniref:phosphatase PAP2 family protein n=1 Tax=Bacillus sp. JJ1521 TaxID=3122957 RepID=UPI002FFEE7F7